MEKTVVVRSMEWEEYVKFVDEMESKRPLTTAKNKDDVEGISRDKRAINAYNMKAADWTMKNIYPDIDKSQYTPSELFYLYIRTMELTTRIRDDELKNLTGFSTGLQTKTDANTVKTAGEPKNNDTKK